MSLPAGTLAAAVVALAAGTGPAIAQQLTAADRLHVVAALWARARYDYAWWDRVRADWDSAFRVTAVEAVGRQTDLRFLRRVRRFAAALNDPATHVVAPSLRGRMARPPLDVRSVDGHAVLVDYVPNDEMRVARPERLAEIVAVQGIPAERWIRDSVLPETGGAGPNDRWRRATVAMLDGERGTAVRVSLRLPDGSVRGASVTRSVPTDGRWPLAPPPVEVRWLPDSTVLVRLNTFADRDVVERFDHAFRDWTGVRALILDLRANGGGDSEIGYRILARLLERPCPTVRRRAPRHQAAFTDGPARDSVQGWTEAPPDTLWPGHDRPPYLGRAALLVSGATAGAAEDLVAAFRAAGRGAVIGEPTAGVAGGETVLPLAAGWTIRLTITRHTLPDGTEYGGVGIRPDIEVKETLGDLREGTDAPLERARALLATRR